LKHTLEKYPRIDVFHFDGWAKHNGITRRVIDPSINSLEDDESLGTRLLERLQSRIGDFHHYDAILVDEAQDFPPVWFSCILEALVDPYDGDLLIVCDGNQGIRLIDAVSWKSLGIKAQGRTIHRAFDLDRNYRNTREILKLASLFTIKGVKENEDSISIVPVDPSLATRRGQKPIIIKCKDHADECHTVVTLSKILLNGTIPFSDLSITLEPQDIGILYRKKMPKDINVLNDFLLELRGLAPVTWLSENYYSRMKVFEPSIKVQTVDSSKGLQYRVIFVIWTDLFEPHASAYINQEQALLYVALTRAEDVLIITYSQPSSFIDKIIESGYAERR